MSLDLEFYPTPRCNLRCSYCYQGRGTPDQRAMYQTMMQYEPLAIDTVLNVIAANAHPGDTLSFTGGESLLNWRWIDRVIDATEQQFKYRIYTNGTLFDKVPDAFLSKLDRVQVSIDGPEAMHDAVRGQGVFTRVIAALPRVKRLVPHVWCRMTIGPSIDLYEAVMGVRQYFETIYWQFENGCDLSKFDAEARWSQTVRLLREWEIRLGTNFRRYLIPFEQAMAALTGQRAPVSWAGCGAGVVYHAVFNDGKIYSCPEQVTKPDAQTGTVENGITRLILLGERAETVKCLGCPAFDVCNCRCYYFVPDEYCAVIMRFVKYMRERQHAFEMLEPAGFTPYPEIELMF